MFSLNPYNIIVSKNKRAETESAVCPNRPMTNSHTIAQPSPASETIHVTNTKATYK